MNFIAHANSTSLPSLVQRAADALLAAKSSAEILEARDMASVAYDAAKSAGRMARAKNAHDTVLAEVYRAQADALLIEARAKMILADEIDLASADRVKGRPKSVQDENAFTAADIGLERREIHEARKLRDAEKAEPGLAERAMSAMLGRGEEPTKAAFRREMTGTPSVETPPRPAPKTMDPKALWLWGRLKDFERDRVLSAAPAGLFSEMTAPMQDDVRRLTPLVRAFLQELEAL